MRENTAPMTASVTVATWKVRRTCRGRPRVSASEIMRLSATGSPAVEIVRSTL